MKYCALLVLSLQAAAQRGILDSIFPDRNAGTAPPTNTIDTENTAPTRNSIFDVLPFPRRDPPVAAATSVAAPVPRGGSTREQNTVVRANELPVPTGTLLGVGAASVTVSAVSPTLISASPTVVNTQRIAVTSTIPSPKKSLAAVESDEASPTSDASSSVKQSLENEGSKSQLIMLAGIVGAVIAVMALGTLIYHKVKTRSDKGSLAEMSKSLPERSLQNLSKRTTTVPTEAVYEKWTIARNPTQIPGSSMVESYPSQNGSVHAASDVSFHHQGYQNGNMQYAASDVGYQQQAYNQSYDPNGQYGYNQGYYYDPNYPQDGNYPRQQ